MKHSWEIIKYVWKEHRSVYYVLGGILICSVFLSKWEGIKFSATFLTDTWNIFEPITGTLTLVAALVLYCLSQRREWEDSLPKFMTAEYIYDEDERLLMKAERVPVAGEYDLRAWGQQLGAQILFGERNLQYFKSTSKKIVSDDGASMEYSVRFYLTSIPGPLKNVYEKDKRVVLRGDCSGKFKRYSVSNATGDEEEFKL
ncbi:MAG: hypothetical protein BA863_07480 [Desulfovibrio sp. S3730MH75]|nr:MAG: hypothetical protein BA863_07480 [Desulfovibrio sp. S3730MH75]